MNLFFYNYVWDIKILYHVQDILENYTQDNSIPIIDSYFCIAIGITPSLEFFIKFNILCIIFLNKLLIIKAKYDVIEPHYR